MADQEFDLQHLELFGLSPTPARGPAILNGHKAPSGLSAYDRYALALLASATDGYVATNNLPSLINAPLRVSQIASSAAIANTGAASYFNKTVTLPAGVANVVGAVIEVTMCCIVGTKAATPGSLSIGLYAGAAAGGALVMAEYEIAAMAAGLGIGTGLAMLARCTVRSTGATGTWARGGMIHVPSAHAQTPNNLTVLTTADLTGALVINGAVDWGTADVDNTITQTQLYATVMLPGATAS